MEVADTFAFLMGTWSIERTLADHRAGLHGLFNGTAKVRQTGPDGSGSRQGRACYEEVGWLGLGSYEGTARRSLGCVRQEDGTVLMHFTDGRLFIVCDLRTGTGQAHHLCGKDRYALTFSVRSADTIEEHWRVRGPGKDYDARSIFRRLPAEVATFVDPLAPL